METGEITIREGIRSKYVSLSNHTRLLVYPHLAVILRDGTVRVVNKDAARVLRMCDGTVTVGDIVKFLSLSPEEESKIIAFLMIAERLGDVILSDHRVSTTANIEEYQYLVPTHVVFEITENCNLNCAHCYRIKDKKPLYIEFDAFKKILDFLVSRGLVGTEITGGEPTLHPHFLDIVEYAAKRVSIVGILTNGVYIPPETTERLAAYREKLFFSVSLDSHDPEYHDKFRGVPGAWKRTVSNIKRLTSAGYNVRIAMTVTPGNIDHIEKTAELAIELGAKMFTYSPMLPFGRAEGVVWSNDDLWKLSAVDRRVREKFGSIIPVVKTEEFGGSIENCGAGWRSVTVGPDMTVRMCVISDPGRDTFVKIDPNDVESAFKKASDVLMFFYTIRAPGRDVCGNCRFLNFCSPCILRARYLLEKGIVSPSQCRWAQKVGMENLKRYLGVSFDE